jgi:hypothetical protein
MFTESENPAIEQTPTRTLTVFDAVIYMYTYIHVHLLSMFVSRADVLHSCRHMPLNRVCPCVLYTEIFFNGSMHR